MFVASQVGKGITMSKMVRVIPLYRSKIGFISVFGVFIFLSFYIFLFGQCGKNVKQVISLLKRNSTKKTLNEWDITLASRKQIMVDHCSKDRSSLNSPALDGHVLINKNYNIAMCFVPKTGCTFWKGVMYKLQISKGRQIRNLSDIQKSQIHYKPIDKLSSISETQNIYSFLRKATKVIFARNPYSRLFSAYVDKFFLPNFWGMGWFVKKGGKDIEKNVKTCGHDVTFHEFVRYVLHMEETEQYESYFIDDHWMPVTRICQPCELEYDVIAKQETFASDRDWILDKLNLTHLLPQGEFINRDDTAKDTMNQTIDSCWSAVTGKKPCLTKLELVQRLWRSFQIQGYLPSSLELPVEQLENKQGDYRENFRAIAMENFDQHKLTREGHKLQRQNEMTIAYNDIPTEMMEKIQLYFHKDFETFAYEKRPSYLYSWR